MAPDLWTCTPCLSVRNEQGRMKKGSGFYIPPALLFSSAFVQQPCRRSSVRFRKVRPTSCCVPILEIKACVLDSVCVIQDNMLQLYEWAAKEFGGMTKGSHGLSFMAEILGSEKALSVIYDWAWLPPRFISDSSNCSYNLDDVLPEYHRVTFRTHIPGTSHVVLPGPYFFRRPRCKHSLAHAGPLSAWAKPFQMVRVRADGFQSRHGMVHDPKSLLNDVCLCNTGWFCKGTVYQFLQPPQAANID